MVIFMFSWMMKEGGIFGGGLGWNSLSGSMEMTRLVLPVLAERDVSCGLKRREINLLQSQQYSCF